MGTTSASAHILWRGSIDDVARAVSRAYVKLGYDRAKKPPTEGGKHVVLLARAGENYASIFDSGNADLDNGELKDAALAASRALKTGAVFTSLYDSDSYEFVVFNNGKQIDSLMSDQDTYSGPLKRLSDKSRATQWSRIFATVLTADAIKQAAARRTAFADDTVAALCSLAGLGGDRPQMNYRDFAREPGSIAAELYFRRKPPARPAAAAGKISLRNYFDRDNSRKLLVYPASWPMPLEQEELLTWLMLSEGAGFNGGTATVEVAGPEGLTFSKGVINGAKFHHGQIVGGYELPKDASPQAAQAYLESKHFLLNPVGAVSPESRIYAAEYPNLAVPAMTPNRTTQIIIILQLRLSASRAGEWDIKVTLQPQSENGYVYELPAVRVAAVDQTWLPVVTGLNPRATYNTADLVEDPLPDRVVDILIRNLGDPRRLAMPPAEARALLLSQQSQARARRHNTWLQDLRLRQPRLSRERGLAHPAIASNVAILSDRGQATLDLCRSYLESWLRPLAGKSGEVRLRAERQMTETLHVGKLKKTWPIASVLEDKAWRKLFDHENQYQTVVIEVVPEGAEIPIAGMGLTCSLRPIKAAGHNREWNEYSEHVMALTLGKMRGRRFDAAGQGETLHVFNWTINHGDCHRYLETSVDDMKEKLDAFAAECPPLQAWHAQSTSIPAFDQADDYEATIYEEMSVLNFFRGILLEHECSLKDRRMTAQWCGNVLRMVTPHMWLCESLLRQLDKASLERAAVVAERNGSYKIEKRRDCAMEDLELALLPILPIETARITVVPTA